MTDNKLAVDEAQRSADYETVKSNVADTVQSEIIAEAARPAVRTDDVDGLASHMRDKATREVISTEHEIERGRVMARVSQVVDYLFFLVYGLLTIRLLLELFAARESAGFFQFIKTATGVFYAPFRGLVPSPTTPEGFTLALPIIIAIIVYGMLHLAINGLLRMFAHRKTEI